MPDIVHDLPISAPVATVFAAITSPEGLDAWWTQRASGAPHVGSDYTLFFGEAYDWRATVTEAQPNHAFALTLTRAMDDWIGTTVTFTLEPRGDGTWLHFAHTGWQAADAHFRESSFCWAMYLRLLRRWVETGEIVPYAQRLEV